jgi:hypothetical protein
MWCKEADRNYTGTLCVKHSLQVRRCKQGDDAFWLYATDSSVSRIRTSIIRFRQHRHKAALTSGIYSIYICIYIYIYIQDYKYVQ